MRCEFCSIMVAAVSMMICGAASAEPLAGVAAETLSSMTSLNARLQSTPDNIIDAVKQVSTAEPSRGLNSFEMASREHLSLDEGHYGYSGEINDYALTEEALRNAADIIQKLISDEFAAAEQIERYQQLHSESNNDFEADSKEADSTYDEGAAAATPAETAVISSTTAAADSAAADSAAESERAVQSAAAPEGPDSAANGFVIVCAIMVILMSVPGIALFYGGLVRSKNVLSIIQQSIVAFGICFILWFLFGYSWAFGPADAEESWFSLILGGNDKIFLRGITSESLSGSLSEFVFIVFQGAFCAISACIIVGATAERIRFGALMTGIAIWAVFSYFPLAHMVWGFGLIEHLFEAWDFAGGTVVHINAAVAGITAALMTGPRIDLHRTAITPHSLPFTYTGCALLWIGWFGFNASSELSPDGVSALAFINTVLAPAAGALTWSLAEKFFNGTTSSLGSSSGVLAGLVGITPACAYVSPAASIIIGVLAALLCLWGVRGFKRMTGVDDSLDVFGVHGLGAIAGAILTGIFCSPDLGGTGFKGSHTGMLSQTMGQIGSVIITVAWSGAVSVVAFWIAGKLFGGLRVSGEDERIGLDLTCHGERGYTS